MRSRNLLRENDLNGFGEGLALSDTARLMDLGQKLSRTGTISFFSFKRGFFEVFNGALHSRDGWSLAPLVVVAIEWEC
jgi:hypothetical protein